MRCFVGIPLPESYQQGLQDIVMAWRGRLASRISWTRKGNWHLTLAFLGDLSESTVRKADECLGSVSMEPFSLQGQGGGFFPPGKTPRVIWVGVGQGRQDCIRLADRIEQALDPIGYKGESRSFHPHLTLGRVKQGRTDSWGALLQALQIRQWPVVEVSSFILWKSDLTPHGPEYSIVKEYPLGARPDPGQAV